MTDYYGSFVILPRRGTRPPFLPAQIIATEMSDVKTVVFDNEIEFFHNLDQTQAKKKTAIDLVP